jgi:hypothetical protein
MFMLLDKTSKVPPMKNSTERSRRKKMRERERACRRKCLRV